MNNHIFDKIAYYDKIRRNTKCSGKHGIIINKTEGLVKISHI